MVVSGAFFLVRGLWRKVTRPTSTKELRAMMRVTLRDMDRLLTLSGGNPRDDVAAMVSRRYSQVARQSNVWTTGSRSAHSRLESGGSVARQFGAGGDTAAFPVEQFRGLAPSELGTLVYVCCYCCCCGGYSASPSDPVPATMLLLLPRYLVVQFKTLLDSYRSHSVMTLSEWVRLSEDLRDLASWELSPQQRTQTLARMRATHGFLLPVVPRQ